MRLMWRPDTPSGAPAHGGMPIIATATSLEEAALPRTGGHADCTAHAIATNELKEYKTDLRCSFFVLFVFFCGHVPGDPVAAAPTPKRFGYGYGARERGAGGEGDKRAPPP